MWKSDTKYLVLAIALLAAISTQVVAQEAALLEVLRSDATFAEKSAACRQLTRIATKESVPTLASLLTDEKLSHMARYALEPIKDASVDDALRNALAEVQGTARLGVIGSLGVRRDAKAVTALTELLKESDTVQATARALGSIGTPEAAQALKDALNGASGGDQLAICEGLLRCAEALGENGEMTSSQAIYDHLRALKDLPTHVRAAALRGAILAHGKDGVPLLVDAIDGSDYALAAAAVRAAMESPDKEITDALAAELPKTPAERQGLLILALADRGDARALPVVLEAAQNSDGQVRILAFRALKRIGDASCVPTLLDAAAEGSDDIAQAAMESLETLQDKSVDEQVVKRLSEAKGKTRLLLLELAARRRTVAATPALWIAVDDDDPAVRAAALTALGAVLEPKDLPKLIARLPKTKDDQDAAALDKALREVSSHAADPEAVTAQFAAALPDVDSPVKARILETLNIVGGRTALETVAGAAKSDDEQLRDAASRVLGQWKSADAAPVLLELHNTATDNRIKIRAIRAYIRIARQFDIPDEQRAAMCRKVLEIADRDEDKRLVLEVLLRYPTDEMQSIAMEAAKIPALKEQALLVAMGMASKGVNRAELGRALAQAGHKPVKLEIIKAEYGAGKKIKDVTVALRKYVKNYRIIFLPNSSYNASLGGDPAPGIVKQLHIKYKLDGKEGEVTLGENATIVLPVPK